MTPEEARAKAEVITSIAEPFSVKIEKNSKGYNYELSAHESSMDGALNTVLKAKAQLEVELYGSVARHNPDAVPV